MTLSIILWCALAAAGPPVAGSGGDPHANPPAHKLGEPTPPPKAGAAAPEAERPREGGPDAPAVAGEAPGDGGQPLDQNAEVIDASRSREQPRGAVPVAEGGSGPALAGAAMGVALVAVLLAVLAAAHGFLLSRRVSTLERQAEADRRESRQLRSGGGQSAPESNDFGRARDAKPAFGNDANRDRQAGQGNAGTAQRGVEPDEVREPAATRQNGGRLPDASTSSGRPNPTGWGSGSNAASSSSRPIPAEKPRSQPPATSPANQEREQWERWLMSVSGKSHGAIVGAIGQVYLDADGMSQGFRDPTNRVEFIQVARTVLTSRLERFAKCQHLPNADFYREWVDPDLLPILNGFSNLYARAVAEARQGNAAAATVAARLHDLLYVQLGGYCQDAGWFGVQVIVPFETEFDPIRHVAIGSAAAAGASNTVVDIRQVGRLDARSGTVVSPAHVVVGQ